jgi:hypothetical protein
MLLEGGLEKLYEAIFVKLKNYSLPQSKAVEKFVVVINS